jgi:hypothetical protein
MKHRADRLGWMVWGGLEWMGSGKGRVTRKGLWWLMKQKTWLEMRGGVRQRKAEGHLQARVIGLAGRDATTNARPCRSISLFESQQSFSLNTRCPRVGGQHALASRQGKWRLLIRITNIVSREGYVWEDKSHMVSSGKSPFPRLRLEGVWTEYFGAS